MEGVSTLEGARTILQQLFADPAKESIAVGNLDSFPKYLKNLNFWLIGGNHSVRAKQQALELRPTEQQFRFTDAHIFINLDQGEMEKVSSTLHSHGSVFVFNDTMMHFGAFVVCVCVWCSWEPPTTKRKPTKRPQHSFSKPFWQNGG